MTKTFKLISSLFLLSSIGCGNAQENRTKKIIPTNIEDKITVQLCGGNPDEIWLNITKSKTETSPSLIQLDQKMPIKQFSSKTEVQADAGLLGIYSNTYKFNPGDSICVEFVNNPKGKYKLPYLTVKNREINAMELNFYYYLNKNRLGINNYEFSSIKRKGTAKESFQSSKLYLDSLHFKNLVSESFWKNTAIEMEYMYYNILLSEYRKGNIQAQKEIPIIAYNNDNMIDNWVYRGFLIKYLEVFIMNSKEWGDVDYYKSYNKVLSTFNGKSKEYLLYYTLNKTNTKDKIKFNALLIDFKSKSKDSEYQSAISKNYEIPKGSIASNKSIIASFDQKTQDYNTFIKSQKGKVIYVDLWASWCSPCRSSMGDSHKLREKYSNQNVLFVYVSIDEKRTAWEEASKEETLSNYSYSFLLTDVKESPLLKELEIKSIPRYLIYDKNGNLVDGDAPNPSSKDLEKTINKYLKDYH